jgi:hypothetical protein
MAIGRAGPICRRAFARLYKSMVTGTYSFWETPAGRSERKRPDAIANVKTRKAIPATGWPTCPRLPAPKRESQGLIPAPCVLQVANKSGASIDGERTRVCVTVGLRQFGSNLGDPLTTERPLRRAGFSKRRSARLAACELHAGRLVTTWRLPRITRPAVKPERACSGSSG